MCRYENLPYFCGENDQRVDSVRVREKADTDDEDYLRDSNLAVRASFLSRKSVSNAGYLVLPGRFQVRAIPVPRIRPDVPRG